MEKQKRKRVNVLRTYRRPDSWMDFAMGMVLTMFGCGLLYMLPTLIEVARYSILVVVIYLGIIGMTLYIPFTYMFIDRLEVTENGLRWWRHGFKKEVAWVGLTGFGLEEYYTRYGKRQRGIMYAYGGNIPVTRYVSVPRGTFHNQKEALRQFKQTEFGRILAENAPHLFDKLNES